MTCHRRNAFLDARPVAGAHTSVPPPNTPIALSSSVTRPSFQASAAPKSGVDDAAPLYLSFQSFKLDDADPNTDFDMMPTQLAAQTQSRCTQHLPPQRLSMPIPTTARRVVPQSSLGSDTAPNTCAPTPRPDIMARSNQSGYPPRGRCDLAVQAQEQFCEKLSHCKRNSLGPDRLGFEFVQIFLECQEAFFLMITLSPTTVEEFENEMWDYVFWKCYDQLRKNLPAHQFTVTFLARSLDMVERLSTAVQTHAEVWDTWKEILVGYRTEQLNRALSIAAQNPDSGVWSYRVAQFSFCPWQRLCHCWKSVVSRHPLPYEPARSQILPILDGDEFVRVFGSLFCGRLAAFDVGHMLYLLDKEPEHHITKAGFLIVRAVLGHYGGLEPDLEASLRLGLLIAIREFIKKREMRYLGVQLIIISAYNKIPPEIRQQLRENIRNMIHGLHELHSTFGTPAYLFPSPAHHRALGDNLLRGTDLDHFPSGFRIKETNIADRPSVTIWRMKDLVKNRCPNGLLVHPAEVGCTCDHQRASSAPTFFQDRGPSDSATLFEDSDSEEED